MFKYLSEQEAPSESGLLIERSLKEYGFYPLLHQHMAAAPALFKAYLDTFALFEKETTLSPLEQQVVFMTTSVVNGCHYCVPGHSYLMKAANMPGEVIEALRAGAPIPDGRLQALSAYTRLCIEKAGHLSDGERLALIDAGFTTRQALEVLVGVAAKLLSNYTAAIARTDLDPPVHAFAWTDPAATGAEPAR